MGHNLSILICCIVDCIFFLTFNLSSEEWKQVYAVFDNIEKFEVFIVHAYYRKPIAAKNITKYMCHIMK